MYEVGAVPAYALEFIHFLVGRDVPIIAEVVVA